MELRKIFRASRALSRAATLETAFLVSAGGILLVTGSAKLVSSLGTDQVLAVTDEIFSIPYWALMRVVGGMELLLLTVLLSCAERRWKLLALASFGSAAVMYRIGTTLLGSDRLCPCLGTLTSNLHVRPNVANSVLFVSACYVAVGSVSFLVFHRLGGVRYPADSAAKTFNSAIPQGSAK